jgi:hypothetical protein
LSGACVTVEYRHSLKSKSTGMTATADGWSPTFGAAVGSADSLYGFVKSAAASLGVANGLLFSGGFGDLQAAIRPYSAILRDVRAGKPLHIAEPVHVAKATEARYTRRTSAGRQARSSCCSRGPKPSDQPPAVPLAEVELALRSPWAAGLPAEAQLCRALWLSREHHRLSLERALAAARGTAGELAATDSPADAALPAAAAHGEDPPEIIIHMPAFGEEGYGSRKECARALTLDHGAANLVIMAPFYSARRRVGQHGYCLHTVADLFAQAFAISLEAAVLVWWAAQRWPRAKLLITGFSFGGAMCGTGACMAAALLSPADRARFGVVPCIGSTSPVVILDGVLRATIDWAALQGGFLRTDAASSAAAAGSSDLDESTIAADAGATKFAAAASGILSEPLARAVEGSSRAGVGPAARAELAHLMECPALAEAPDARTFLYGLLGALQTGTLIDALQRGADAALPRKQVGGSTSDAEVRVLTATAGSAAPAAPPFVLFGAVSSVAAAHDGFVSCRHSLDQHACLAAAAAPGRTSSVVISGGHISAFIRRKYIFVTAVRRAAALLQMEPT